MSSSSSSAYRTPSGKASGQSAAKGYKSIYEKKLSYSTPKSFASSGVASPSTPGVSTPAAKSSDSAEFDRLPADLQSRLFRADNQAMGLKAAKTTEFGVDFTVRGLSEDYVVRLGRQKQTWSCGCHDFQKIGRQQRNCKHILFVKMRVLPRGVMPVWTDGDDKSKLHTQILAQTAAPEVASRVQKVVQRHCDELRKDPRRREAKRLLKIWDPTGERIQFESAGIPTPFSRVKGGDYDSDDEYGGGSGSGAKAGEKRKR